MRRTVVVAFMGLAVLVAAAPAGAVPMTRYAEPNGNGTPGLGGCLVNDPCSLQAAVEDPSVSGGDEIVVLPGTYEPQTTALLISDPIVVHGVDGTATMPLPRIAACVAGMSQPTGPKLPGIPA